MTLSCVTADGWYVVEPEEEFALRQAQDAYDEETLYDLMTAMFKRRRGIEEVLFGWQNKARPGQ